jgi:hypothetical protein
MAGVPLSSAHQLGVSRAADRMQVRVAPRPRALFLLDRLAARGRITERLPESNA